MSDELAGPAIEPLGIGGQVFLDDEGDTVALYVEQGVERVFTKADAEQVRDWLTRWLDR